MKQRALNLYYISLFGVTYDDENNRKSIPTSPYPSQNPRARHQEERRDPTHSTGRDSDSNKNTSNLDHPLFSTAWETSVAQWLTSYAYCISSEEGIAMHFLGNR